MSKNSKGLGRKLVESRFPIVRSWPNDMETEKKIIDMFLDIVKEEADSIQSVDDIRKEVES